MGKAEKRQALLIQLGGLARERLVNRPDRPRSIDRVLKAEQAVDERRDELEWLERRLNGEDAALAQSHRAFAEEKRQHLELIERFRPAVEAVKRRARALRREVLALRAGAEAQRTALAATEEHHRALQRRGSSDEALQRSRDSLKRLRLAALREQRELEERERELTAVLTPGPGQSGSAGILAYRRLLELEEEMSQLAAQAQATMADVEARLAAKEQELDAAQQYLDQALGLLGEDCYQARIADPMLAALYPKIDKVR